MQIVTDRQGLRRRRKPIVLATGFFDGVHRGHRRVLEAARERAHSRNAAAWVMTFDVHPLSVLNPSAAPRLLTGPAHKLRLMAELGFDGAWVLPFDRAMAERSREEFTQALIEEAPSVREIFAGRNWRFGQGGRGSAAWLSRWARSHGHALAVVAVAPMTVQGRPVSSSRVRAAVGAGRLDEAERLLGRRFSVWGAVVKGRGVGRALGWPTANIVLGDALLPPAGVYAVRVRIEPRRRRRWVDGVLNLGRRPTFVPEPQAPLVAETHLFDVDADLYGREIEVAFVERLRAERPFASRADLSARIREDVARARARLQSAT